MRKIEQLLALQQKLGIAIPKTFGSRHQTSLVRLVENDKELQVLIQRQIEIAKDVYKLMPLNNEKEELFKKFLRLLYQEYEYAINNPNNILDSVGRIRKIRIHKSLKIHFIHYLISLLKARDSVVFFELVRELSIFRDLFAEQLKQKIRHGISKIAFRSLEIPIPDGGDIPDEVITQAGVDRLNKLYDEADSIHIEIERYKSMETSPVYQPAKDITDLKNKEDLAETLREFEEEKLKEESNIGERERIQKDLGLTLDRATLFLNYLFTNVNVNCRNTKKAEVISFLTGYRSKKIGQSFSRIEKEKLEIEEKGELSKKNSDDVRILRKYFEMLGLRQILEEIDKDFGH